MSAALSLSAPGEEAWLKLRYHVEWAEGFALIFIFSSNPALHSLFRERLARIYQTRVSHLEQMTPQSASTLVEDIMTRLGTPLALPAGVIAPLWLDLTADDQEGVWQQARETVLARLNEYRDTLRQRQRRPLILVLPSGFRPRLRELAPDLWAIRHVSLDLEEAISLHQASLLSDRPERRLTADESPAQNTTSFFDEAQIHEWERLKRRGTVSRDALFAGWRATDAALAARRLSLAAALAVEVLALARTLATQHEASDTPETVRDLSVALEKVGDTARALGRLEEAEGAYQESLALRRQQRERLGDTPETVRDLSIALEKVGDTARALGRLEEAEGAYQESLALWQRLALAFLGVTEYPRQIARLQHTLAALSQEHEKPA